MRQGRATMRKSILPLLVALCVPMAARAAAEKDPRLALLEAMQAEQARSMAKLRLEGYEAPYFIGYQVKDTEHRSVSGRYGALFGDEHKRDRRLFVDVRVGSYELDNSGSDPLAAMMDLAGDSNFQPRRDAPIDDDPGALRNALWLMTDERYKAALAAWLEKRGKRVYRLAREDEVASFARQKPSRFVQAPVPFAFSGPKARRLVREIGALFRAHPEIFDSDVRVEADKVTRYYVSSEGTALVTESTLFAIHVQAVTRAEDGQLLENGRDYYAASEAGLPDLERVRRETLEMIEQLLALRRAPVIEPYTGPAILAPMATGVLFHEVLGHRLEGDRQEEDWEGRTFKGQIGRRVLPEFLSLIDDPTLRQAAGQTLNGSYLFDEEGVPAQRVTLIDEGVLRGFLMSRRPVKGFDRSNGHGRSSGARAPAARMANLIVESSRTKSMDELKRMLIAEAKRQGKPYALILEDITGGETNTSSYGYQAFKGHPRLVYRIDVETGREELVRGVEMVGTPLTILNKIAATGDRVGVFNGFCGAESGYVPVSTVAPAALVTELELQRTAQARERLPLLPSPWAIDGEGPPQDGEAPAAAGP
jgi:TldD protein